MDINATRGILASSAALSLILGLAGTALGEETPAATPTMSQPTEDDSTINTVPPAEPTEDVSDAPAVDTLPDSDPVYTPTGKPSPMDTPDSEYCGPSHGVYVPISKGTKYHKAVGATQSNYNGTSRTARSTFTSELSGEVGVSISGTLKVSATVLVATLEEQWNVSLSVKLTAKLGNSISVDTPARKTTNAKYGVYRLQHTGKSYILYSNCKTSTQEKVVTYTPYRVGWYLWETR